MKIDIFKSIHTDDDINNTIGILHAMSKEQGVSIDKMLEVENTEYNKLRYVTSNMRMGVVHTNFFQYKDNDSDLLGLCSAKGGSTNLEKWADPLYVSLVCIHNNIWLGLRQDSMFDLYVDKQKVLDGFKSYDILQLEPIFTFLQIDTVDYRSLICCDNSLVYDGCYSPTGLDDFLTWYEKNVITRGYEGGLDNLQVSKVFSVYYEVQNCIFSVRNYKTIDLRAKA